MKTLRREPVELVECEEMPNLDDMKQGVMYYIPSKKIAYHLCLCGCGSLSGMSIDDAKGWIIHRKDKLTVTPSILMEGGSGCRSHYIITNGIANFV